MTVAGGKIEMKRMAASNEIKRIEISKKHYQRAFEYLKNYESDSIKKNVGNLSEYTISVEECRLIIEELVDKKMDDNQLEKLKKYISEIYQSFLGEEVYKSTEAKAVKLLYLLINDEGILKNNIECAVSVFLYFLDKNGLLYSDGEKNISDKTLVLLTILLKTTRECDKEKTINLITNFLAEMK